MNAELGIRCGHCKGRHSSVQDVRECSMISRVQSEAMGFISERNGIKAVSSPKTILDSGFYKRGEVVFKVYAAQQHPDRMLAKRLAVGSYGKASWEYAGLASRFVSASDLLSLEDAKKFGRIYGVCCVCGRTLTDEQSVLAGIGPVCANRWSL